jgi:ABC-2 type transport system permease protein
LRTPGALIPSLPLPIFLYLLIGVVIVSPGAEKNPALPLYMFAGFAVFGVSGPGMFGFGIGLAIERYAGVLTLKRAQPMPIGAHIVAKMITAIICSLLVIVCLISLAIGLGHVPLTAIQVVLIIASSTLGIITFSAIGFYIGSVASGTAAPGIVNLIYFPMMYLSGMFFPLPKTLATWAVIWPTFYMDQLIMAAGGGKHLMDPTICVAVLVGLAVLFGGLAIRRLARVG